MKLFKWIADKFTAKDRQIAKLQAELAEVTAANLRREKELSDLSAANQRLVERELDLRASHLRASLNAVREEAVRPLRRVPERAMPKAELVEALAVDNDDPLWRAIHQLLDEAQTDAVDLVSARPAPDSRSGLVTVSPDTRNFHAGGIDHLREFQTKLLDLQAAALKAEDRA